MNSVADRIEHLIAEKGLKPGERLPPERRLAADLGISRSRLREAIQQLASRGILRSRQGGGTFVVREAVAEPIAQALLPLSAAAGRETGFWRDVMEVRRSLDGVAAFQAAIRAGDADRDKLRRLLGSMRPGGEEQGSPAQADAALHIAIAEASRNIVLRQIMVGLHDVLEASIAESLARLRSLDGAEDTLAQQHSELVEAIVEGRAEDARVAAERHLDFVERNLRRIEDEAERERRAARMLAHVSQRKEAAP